MREKYRQELEKLHGDLTEMGRMCEQAIDKACRALLQNDRTAMEQLRTGDVRIDQKEKDIERQCLSLMLRQQPVASDLRKISVALKMITDMERIGDQAQDIAEIVSTGKVHALAAREADLDEMAEATKYMVTESIRAYVQHDLALARDIIGYDDTVDGLFDKVKKFLIEKLESKELDAAQMLDLLMIAKYYERIGDHATNIAEWVVFGITGEHEDVPD